MVCTKCKNRQVRETQVAGQKALYTKNLGPLE